MPRAPRVISESGYYHVMLRGAGRQIIFEDDDDRRFFMGLVRNRFAEHSITMLAWCLMENHIHLIALDPLGNLSRAMHAIATGYACRFNARAGHVGPVFQDRFRSVPITSDVQLLQAVRYVHANPVKAGISPMEEYRWSSYREYLSEAPYVDTSIVLGLLGGVGSFVAYSHDYAGSSYYFKSGSRIDDADMLAVFRSACPGMEPPDIKTLTRPKRNAALAALKEKGLSVRQIERLTGVGKNVIVRALRK